jgi:hypothetical protein
MANHEYLAERPTASLGSIAKSRQQLWDLGEDGSDGKPVADGDLQIVSRRTTPQ